MLHNRLRRSVLKPQNLLVIISLAIAGGFLIWQYGNFTVSRKTSPPDAAAYILSEMESCRVNPRLNCYRDAAGLFLSRFPLKQILEVFKKAGEEGKDFPDCHQLAHFLGRKEYHRLGSVPEVFDECLYICGNGCYHGAVDGYFEKYNLPLIGASDKILGEAVEKICGFTFTASDYYNPQVYYDCPHGIGHNLMYVTEMNLPRSLRLCDVLPAEEERQACYSGIFMENANSFTGKDHPSQFVKKDDPLYPCGILEKRYREQCYVWQISNMATIIVPDWQERIKLCASGVPKEYREACFKSFGKSAGNPNDFEGTKEKCGSAPEKEFREACIRGAVVTLVSKDLSDSRTVEFCSLVNVELKPACYGHLGGMWSWLRGAEEGQAACRRLPEQNSIKWCLEGATGNVSN